MSDEFVKRLVFSCVLAAAAVPVPAAAQEPLGRLFFTPAQRASLDIARARRARTTLSTERAEEAAPVAQSITYGGMVRRSDGKSTVWLNNRPVNDQELAGGASIVGRVRPDGSITLQVPQSGRSVDLKPGQSVELLSGTIEEAYSRKPVQPEPKPAAKSATEAKPTTKPALPDRSAEERNREERERVEEAVSRALQESAGAKPGAVSPSPPAERPR